MNTLHQAVSAKVALSPVRSYLLRALAIETDVDTKQGIQSVLNKLSNVENALEYEISRMSK